MINGISLVLSVISGILQKTIAVLEAATTTAATTATAPKSKLPHHNSNQHKQQNAKYHSENDNDNANDVCGLLVALALIVWKSER